MKVGDRVKVVRYISDVIETIAEENERFFVLGQTGILLEQPKNLIDTWRVDLEDNGRWDYWLLRESELEVIEGES